MKPCLALIAVGLLNTAAVADCNANAAGADMARNPPVVMARMSAGDTDGAGAAGPPVAGGAPANGQAHKAGEAPPSRPAPPEPPPLRRTQEDPGLLLAGLALMIGIALRRTGH